MHVVGRGKERGFGDLSFLICAERKREIGGCGSHSEMNQSEMEWELRRFVMSDEANNDNNINININMLFFLNTLITIGGR